MKYSILVLITLAASSSATYADCSADLDGMLMKLKSAGPYHVSMTTTFNETANTIEADVILPSSFHMKSAKMEVIMLKSGGWMKMGGAWRAMPSAVTSMTGSLIDEGMKKGVKGVQNPTCLGPQEFQGQSYEAFSYDSASKVMGVSSKAHATLYMDSTGLPAWVVVDGTAMGKPSHTVQHIIYDPSIKITAPK